jgi:carbon-monoxide dehydrogenase small subunit
MKQLIKLNINGDSHEVAVEPYDTVLRVLRNDLHCKGAKQGCDTGGCGCCSVLVDGEVVYSCMTYVMSVEGKEITTIEGISSGDQLDPLQAAFVELGAVQCGYCTCGIIMAAKSFLSKNPNPTESEIRDGISGNLCRCTGYTKIIEAIKLASQAKN